MLSTPALPLTHRSGFSRGGLMPTIRVPLHSRKYPSLFAHIDEADAELVSQYRWHPHVLQDRQIIYAYASKSVGGKHKNIKMHRLIMGLDSVHSIDHINTDGLDNRRSNLRFATRGQNGTNRSSVPNSSSRFKGVNWHKGGQKWRATITACGKFRHLGMFDNEEDAARSYDVAALLQWGEFARLNFPVKTEVVKEAA